MYTIALDVDGTIANLGEAWLARYNKDYNDALSWDSITEWNTHNFVKPECGEKIYDYLKDPSLYDEVKPIDGALEASQWLKSMGHRVFYATTTPPESAGAKYFWLKKHGFINENKDYMEVADKSLIYADFLIDDGLHNIKAFKQTSILYKQPWNDGYDGYTVTSWMDFIEKWKDEKFIHPTVSSRPYQTNGFLNTVMDMYKVHLDKNADYSPANILGTGEIGLMTRVWDKVSRLMNLQGFKINVELEKFDKPVTPKNESIDDSIMDLAVYSVIWMLYRRGVWGK